MNFSPDNLPDSTSSEDIFPQIMKRKSLFFSFLSIIFVSLVSVWYRVENNKFEYFFSSNIANPINLEDTSFGGGDGVFVLKNGFQKRVYASDKQLQDIAFSPSRKQVIFSYYEDRPKGQGLSLVLFDLNNGKTQEILHTNNPSWDITGDIHWLGDDYIIFFRHCGTSCQGITLLDVRDGGATHAVLSYMSFLGQPSYTHFRDWFGDEHKMENFVDTIGTENVDGKSYLIFEMKSDTGETSGQKKFLFTGNSLVLKSERF